MPRDLSAFFQMARIGRIKPTTGFPAWTECCTNGRCNSCK